MSGAEMKSSRAGTLTARPRVLSPQVHGRSRPSEARTQRAEVGRRPRASGSGTCARPRGRSSPEGEAGSLASIPEQTRGEGRVTEPASQRRWSGQLFQRR